MTERGPSRHEKDVAGLVLTPGAGTGADHTSLVEIDRAVSAAGIEVARVDFPYRLVGRRVPDRPPVLVATVRQASGTLAASLGVPTSSVALGGRSMGGRMCSMAVAGGFEAAALVLVSYPLHPPGRSDRARTEHLPGIRVPCLFVSGTRDAFGSPAELEAAASRIHGPVTHVWVEGGDHSLRRHEVEVAGVVARWLAALPARQGRPVRGRLSERGG